MAQPSGFAEPIDALLAVATCLGDFTIPNDPAEGVEAVQLEPRMFVGDEGVGGTIDCCFDGKPILRIESLGENPAAGTPINLGKHGCVELSMGIKVTFLTCFKTITKQGVVITNPDELAYSRTIQASRWRALGMLKCCNAKTGIHAIKFVSSVPINTDGKCSGWQITLVAALSLCGCPETASS